MGITMCLLVPYVQPYASNQDGNCCWHEATGTTKNKKNKGKDREKNNAI